MSTVLFMLLACPTWTSGLRHAAPIKLAALHRRAPCAPHHRRHAAPRLQGDFEFSGEQFDLLALRSFRRDALLQYDATNQSEPLRIALSFLGILFGLSYPSLAGELGSAPGGDLATTAASLTGAAGCALLFQRNRAARYNRPTTTTTY